MKQLIQYTILIILVSVALIVFMYNPDVESFGLWVAFHILYKFIASVIFGCVYWLVGEWEDDLTLMTKIADKAKETIEK